MTRYYSTVDLKATHTHHSASQHNSGWLVLDHHAETNLGNDGVANFDFAHSHQKNGNTSTSDRFSHNCNTARYSHDKTLCYDHATNHNYRMYLALMTSCVLDLAGDLAGDAYLISPWSVRR